MLQKLSLRLWFLLWIFICLSLPVQTLAEKSLGEILCADTGNYNCLVIEVRDVPLLPSDGQTTDNQCIPSKKVLDTWESLFPDEREREIVKKLNRINIDLRQGMKLAVPLDMTEKTFLDYSPFPLQEKPSGERILIFDPALLAFAVYDQDGLLERWGPAVGGKDWCDDVKRSCRTKTGEFRIYEKGGANYRSGKYPVGCSGNSCAKMPYALFFTPGYAFHSGKLAGKQASHGCVRVFYSDAQWLDDNIKLNTRIIIRPYPKK